MIARLCNALHSMQSAVSADKACSAYQTPSFAPPFKLQLFHPHSPKVWGGGVILFRGWRFSRAPGARGEAAAHDTPESCTAAPHKAQRP